MTSSRSLGTFETFSHLVHFGDNLLALVIEKALQSGHWLRRERVSDPRSRRFRRADAFLVLRISFIAIRQRVVFRGRAASQMRPTPVKTHSAESERGRRSEGDSVCVSRGLDVSITQFLGGVTMLRLMKNWIRREEGASMVEYGLMVALIAAVCITAVTALGTSVSALFTSIAGSL